MTQEAARESRPNRPQRRRISLQESRLAALLGFNLGLAYVAVYRDFVTANAALKLTPRLYAVLELIAENPGVSQADVAAALVMDRATMMAVVDRLEARAFVQRHTSPIDRRRQDLFVTDAGSETLVAARDTIAAQEKQLVAGWSAADKALMLRLLQKFQERSKNA